MVDMSVLVGTVRTFGASGPPYVVLGPAEPSVAGEPQMRIHLLESNEDVEYEVAQLVNDPRAD